LQNLLNNEQIKFQAQAGLNSAGQMAGAPQNQPNASVNIQPASTTGALGAAGQTLGGLTLPNQNQVPQSVPNDPTTGNVLGPIIGTTPPLGTPTVQGWGVGGGN
jgi:hypothetical protein